MIAREDYVGPITKAAEAMFARAERKARQRSGQRRAIPSPIHDTLHALGLTITVLRHWEDAGLIAFERRAGRRVVDDEGLERLRAVIQLRRAGFSVRQIAWLSPDGPPGLTQMREALAARIDHVQTVRETALARARNPRAA